MDAVVMGVGLMVTGGLASNLKGFKIRLFKRV
jgi:hypothetical protein